MNEIKIFLFATSGTLFMQVVEPLHFENATETYKEMLLRAGLSLLVGVITTLTYKIIENLKLWKHLSSQCKRLKQRHTKNIHTKN